MKTFAFVFLLFRQLFEQNIVGISVYLPSGYELCHNSIRRPYPKRLLLPIVSSLFFESVCDMLEMFWCVASQVG